MAICFGLYGHCAFTPVMHVLGSSAPDCLVLLWLQDERVMQQIERYFNKKIGEINWDDEDTFLKVLKESL
jgi:hypothetical protein